MLGQQLESANHVLTLIVEGGFDKQDKNVAQATSQLSNALQVANDLPELKTAYQAVVNAYYAYISHSQ